MPTDQWGRQIDSQGKPISFGDWSTSPAASAVDPSVIQWLLNAMATSQAQNANYPDPPDSVPPVEVETGGVPLSAMPGAIGGGIWNVAQGVGGGLLDAGRYGLDVAGHGADALAENLGAWWTQQGQAAEGKQIESLKSIKERKYARPAPPTETEGAPIPDSAFRAPAELGSQAPLPQAQGDYWTPLPKQFSGMDVYAPPGFTSRDERFVDFNVPEGWEGSPADWLPIDKGGVIYSNGNTRGTYIQNRRPPRDLNEVAQRIFEGKKYTPEQLSQYAFAGGVTGQMPLPKGYSSTGAAGPSALGQRPSTGFIDNTMDAREILGVFTTNKDGARKQGYELMAQGRFDEVPPEMLKEAANAGFLDNDPTNIDNPYTATDKAQRYLGEVRKLRKRGQELLEQRQRDAPSGLLPQGEQAPGPNFVDRPLWPSGPSATDQIRMVQDDMLVEKYGVGPYTRSQVAEMFKRASEAYRLGIGNMLQRDNVLQPDGSVVQYPRDQYGRPNPKMYPAPYIAGEPQRAHPRGHVLPGSAPSLLPRRTNYNSRYRRR